jgi:hypothetical protein
MGKFTLQAGKGTVDFHLGLCGSNPEEQKMQITVTSGTKKQQVELTALAPKMVILL